MDPNSARKAKGSADYGRKNKFRLTRRRKSVVMRIAQGVRLQGSTLLFVVEHESTINKFDVVRIVRGASSARRNNLYGKLRRLLVASKCLPPKHNNHLASGRYERLRWYERTQIISSFPCRGRANFEQRLLVPVGRDINNFNHTSARWRPATRTVG